MQERDKPTSSKTKSHDRLRESSPDVDNCKGNAMPEYPQWVVVENAGTDWEDIWTEHHTIEAARREFKYVGGRENGYDLMKRLPDGTLTTEF